MRQAVQAREKQYHHLDQSPRQGGMFELWEDGTLVAKFYRLQYAMDFCRLNEGHPFDSRSKYSIFNGAKGIWIHDDDILCEG